MISQLLRVGKLIRSLRSRVQLQELRQAVLAEDLRLLDLWPGHSAMLKQRSHASSLQGGMPVIPECALCLGLVLRKEEEEPSKLHKPNNQHPSLFKQEFKALKRERKEGAWKKSKRLVSNIANALPLIVFFEKYSALPTHLGTGQRSLRDRLVSL